MPPRRPIATETSQAYATSTEFCRVFADNMDSMHLLSFLLTADPTKAEELRSVLFPVWKIASQEATCFETGRDPGLGGRLFKMQFACWRPTKNRSVVTAAPSDPVNCRLGRTSEADAAITSVLGLEDFERFVFVMSVLERYSDQDCSVLLGCSRQDVGETRMRALLLVEESDRLRTVAPSGCGSSDPEEA